MKVTLESTTKIVDLNGVPARVWEGKTESGIEVHAFVTRIGVSKGDDQTEFQKELQGHRPPKNAEIEKYPLRMLI